MAERLDKTEWICEICGRPYGSCDTEIHKTRLSPGYSFGTQAVATTFFRESISPRMSVPKNNKNGQLEAQVLEIKYN